MIQILSKVVAVIVAGTAFTSVASAQTFVNSFRDWNLYTHDSDQGKVCYIASEPIKEEGNYRRRGAAAVIVAHWPLEDENEQVSIQPGYDYLQKSKVEVTVDNQGYELFTDSEHAWTDSAADDKILINAMMKGSKMSVRGTSSLKTFSLDTYSLLGFTAALKSMRDTCG